MISHPYRETQQAIEKVFEKQIFFVAGVLRSGTTWLRLLLDAHPEIACGGEAHFIDSLYPKFATVFEEYNREAARRNRYRDRWLFEEREIIGDCPAYTAEDVNHIFATAVGLVFVRWADVSDVKCIGEKTPENARALDFLANTIPGSKFIHIIRDGRDAAVSTWAFNNTRDRDQRQVQLTKFPTFALFAEHFAETWSANVTRIRDFGTANPDRYFELRYEDLHQAPVSVLCGLFEFLGVATGDGVVSDCIRAASFEHVTGGRKRGEEQAGAQMRKGIIGDWRNRFDEADRATFHKHAGDLLKELGYTDL